MSTNPESPADTPAPPGPHDPPAPHDPEVEALLGFAPVRRRCVRHDGWSPRVQRGFIAALARLGSVPEAAHAVGRTESGAYKVRTSAGGAEFGDAWDEALALYVARHPRQERAGRPSRGEKLEFARFTQPAQPREPRNEEEEFKATEACLLAIFEKYELKLAAEREARLSGRVSEADFYVRQITWLEVAMDIGGKGEAVAEWWRTLKLGHRFAGNIVATPASVMLDYLRRGFWDDMGEPQRPPPPPLGRHDDTCAWGMTPESETCPERDGRGYDRPGLAPYLERNAEAERAWRQRAEADAKDWAEPIGYEPPPQKSFDEELAEAVNAAAAALGEEEGP
jgi:hypothetical protein